MERRADSSSQLEIDQAVLDYLTYSAIKSLLDDNKLRNGEGDRRSTHGCHVDTLLQMVNSFLTVFKTIHPGENGTKGLQMRLRLLRFTTSFCSRFTSANIKPSKRKLHTLRETSRKRRKALEPTRFPADTLDGDLAEVVADTVHERNREGDSQTDPYGPAHSTSLISTLPLFMALSAAQSVVQEQSVSQLWMEIAAGYMAHAALEQSLVYGVGFKDALEEAFAWRFDPECLAEQGTDDWAINAMFVNEDGEVGWDNIRNEHIRIIIPPKGVSLHAHAKMLLAKELPVNALEERLMNFIEGLLNAHPKPIYTQLELGKVDGLSMSETQALREVVGIKE